MYAKIVSVCIQQKKHMPGTAPAVQRKYARM